VDRTTPAACDDERYFDSPYYLVPNEPVGQEAFAVIRDPMRGKDMVALGSIVLAKRERVVMLQPWDKGLVGTTLRYRYEVRDTKDYFNDIPEMKLQKDMLQLAEHILDTKAADFDPGKFEDRYENAVVEMIQRKRAGMPVST
jgi:DNA end-binding protein Ku